MPIPDSTLPGHRALHERVVAALELCQEGISIEFKGSGTWEQLKNKIVKNVLGMGNLRDGGIMVIGVSENAGRWQLGGITEEHLATFEPDDVLTHVGRYVSTAFHMNVVRVAHSGTQFLVIQTQEFDETPFVCRRNGPDGPMNEGLVAGGVYIRLAVPPSTTRVMDAVQMHDLLDLAAEKRARKLLEQVRRVGAGQPSAVDQLDQELEDL